MWARRFLLVIFALTLLVCAGAFALFQFGGKALKSQSVPTIPYKAPPRDSGPDYIQVDNWLAIPGTIPANPAEWLPAGLKVTDTKRRAATFYIHPTTYLQRDRWNALIGDEESQARAALFVRSQASAFNGVSEVYAPKYRQAAFGAFLDTGKDASGALDLAYRDVASAFDRFLAQVGPDQPIILVGHSQGALHLTRLLREKIAGKPVARRIVAAYVIGWPVSVASDLPAMGLPACTAADQTRCLLSWMSFGSLANTGLITDVYDDSVGFDGRPRRREDLLCVNPLTGTRDGRADPAANLGTLVPNAALTEATLAIGQVGAVCDKGFLTVTGTVPAIGPYVLPGGNYHVYDVALFWANVRADVGRRLAAFR
jgi:pimeloyl-ACP methyl ester carboxylesterase